MNLLKKEVYFEKNGVCTFYDFANELSYDELLSVNGGCGGGQKVQNSAITLLPPNYEGKGTVASNDIVRSRCGGGIFVNPYPPSLPYSENESAEGFSIGTSGKCGGGIILFTSPVRSDSLSTILDESSFVAIENTTCIPIFRNN